MAEGLKIEELRLAGFRNHDDFRLDDVGNLTILVGKNEVGKTNVLEGISLLTACESFRHAPTAQMIGEGRQMARLSSRASDGNRVLDVSLTLEPGKKKFELNGKAKAATDVKGTLPCVSFTPDDLELAKKTSSVKRSALDSIGMQLSKSYHVVYRDFEKAVRYKNRLLKEEADPFLVESINDTLVICASQLFCYRASLFKRMIPLVRRNYADISHSNEGFDATYEPSWQTEPLGDGDIARDEVKTQLERAYAEALEEERTRRRSIVGPQADAITFTLSGKDASQYASQGQQRSIVLAWKLAEVEVVERSLSVSPVLLLDDVMSELDESRREKLVELVGDGLQTFVTTTDLSGMNGELLKKAQVVEL